MDTPGHAGEGQESVDVCVIGAGVIGLAVAARLAHAGREVLVIESAGEIASGISSRNSGVIHAGIYYPPGSLKARLCVRGRELLYRFCDSHHVDHQRCGKLIVATQADQHDTLAQYHRRAQANGVDDLEWLNTGAVREREPEIAADAALYSPSTGIVDSHGLCVALQGELEQGGGDIALGVPVTGLAVEDDGVCIETPDLRLTAKTCINAAGLAAASLARAAGLADVPRYFARGHYYRLSGRSPFRHLVYPLADNAGLGIHVTLDLGGQARLGPDVQWVDEPDHRFDESRLPRFVEAVRRYYPGLDPDRLSPDSTGIRPKLVPAGEPPADFRPELQRAGNASIVHMLGIESPGLTASLALAEHVEELLRSS